MKNILFMTSVMGSGGVEKALINLLNVLVENPELNITVLLLKPGGAFLKQLPPSVNVKILSLQGITYENIFRRTSLKRTVFENVCRLRLIQAFSSVFRMIVKKDYFYYLPGSIEKIKILDTELEKEYDLAVCYHIHFPFNLVYVAKRVKAKKKVAWIHNDFKTTCFPVDQFKRYLNDFNEFFAVSERLKNEFQELVPEFREKVKVLYNILPVEKIVKLADELYPSEYSMDDRVKILSIGRLNKQKGFDLAVKVCHILKEKHLRFIWYILGEGEEGEMLTKDILSLGLQDDIKLMGVRENPYPYIKNCDIYVQPSRHEGYGLAVAEARILCKPIVCTDFAGAREQLVDGKTGLIVPTNEKPIASAVSKLITDSSLRKYFCDNLRDENEQIKDYNQLTALITKYL